MVSTQKTIREEKKTRAGFGKVFFVALLLLGISAPQAHAGYWGESISAAIMKQAMEKIYNQIQGVLLGTLKVAAVQTLNAQVGQLIGGGVTGKPLFITNYNSFLYQDPLQKTNLYMNDFFTSTTRGKGSSANYISAGDVSGVSNNYPGYLEQLGRQATTDKNTTSQYSLDQYTSSPQTMFTEGDWRGFNAFVSNPANNPYGYTLMAESAYQNKLSSEIEIQKVKAQSSGFQPVEKSGQVVTPAGSLEALTTNVQNMGNNIITNATNPSELLSGVVTSMVNKTVNGLVQTGIGQVQANIQREIGGVAGQVNGTLRDATQSLGPAARFMPAVIQKININAGSGAPAIPSNTISGPAY